MKNRADVIESFIVGQILAASKNAVMVRRNELADRLSCAPSQISYVLSTRFTPEKGYLVESRRGSGGFIRIVRIVPAKKEQDKEKARVVEILDYWLQNRLLTTREHAMLTYVMSIMDITEDEKREVLYKTVQKMVDAD